MSKQCVRVAIVAAVLAICGALLVPATGGATPSDLGYDGTTVKVAGLDLAAQLPGAESGARARVAKFNADNEIKGVKIDSTGFADDKLDPATALSEARRLVTQDQVFGPT